MQLHNVAAYIMETSVVTAVSYNGNKLCKCLVILLSPPNEAASRDRVQ